MKLQRLQKMSVEEIAHRLRERLRRESDRRRFQTGVDLDEDRELDALIERHGSSLKSYFCNGPARRFYPSTFDQSAALQFVDANFPQWFDRAVQQAGVLCEHRVNLLGFTDVQLGGNIDWHRDPVSGFQWPRQYCDGYDLVHHPPADAKVIHELNRHQHLPRLAKAFFLTGDEPYALEAITQLESWIAQNPKWDGV